MTKDEYFMLLGKHKHAMIELAKASRESMRAYDDVQSWANGLLINKLDEQYAARGHALIDRLLESKQMEGYWKAEEMRLLKALDEQANQPLE
ncbi:hypothetical protein [Nitrosomonas sp.]|uniref:hypothetical protein n=1 Tax=Nitrosomonas sp. TaxID=42353 RepID=UPI0025F8E244|nr:hypothetical protein [Nitrosomonas sp.]MBV6447263.1 hypothetical protein [Nitrosomonas sp.]